MLGMPNPVADPVAHVFGRSVRDERGCLVWTGAATQGYGYVRVRRRLWRVHRFVYEHLLAAIPPGHDIDHACGNRRCIEPAHLRALPMAAHRRLHARARWAA